MSSERDRPCVVCGIADASSGAKVARVAARLSERFDARLVLVHVADIAPSVMYGVPFDSERFHTESQKRSQEVLEAVAAETGTAEADQRIAWGSPATALLRLVAEEHAILLVVGTRAHHELQAAVLGSVSHRVTAEAPCPVVVVPPRAADLPG